ncbi:hypothetical protein [Streptomyces wuyuanensis]|uniref:Uncharacterized protein n=1 Tax=Streptomyces wuyuanensis TaxID=1196353 RepID=A0A1H0A895_9ACTN|nr:hypothetical protein [Streptomyces wuyuanensis]SDN29637.1 hypothetical protein SAMN05444921_123135 [Streptomyces wuyuanensis]
MSRVADSGGRPRSADGPRGCGAPRTYWEHRGPRTWTEVTVRVRYGDVTGEPAPAFPLVRTARRAPRNVLVERADGTREVKPVRLLRREHPRPAR